MVVAVRDRLSYANVMATAAVFFALGGTSYAAFSLPANSVGTKQIKARADCHGITRLLQCLHVGDAGLKDVHPSAAGDGLPRALRLRRLCERQLK